MCVVVKLHHNQPYLIYSVRCLCAYRRFFIAGAEGLTFFSAGKRNVGWSLFSMFFSSFGIVSDHICARVAQLDKQKIANRVRKQTVKYKKRDAALAYKHLQDAETRKQATALKAYSYSERKDKGMMVIGEADVAEHIEAAQERRRELKAMKGKEVAAAWASGDTVGLVRCECGWISKGKHSATHKTSVAHLNWRWTSNDREGLLLCATCTNNGKHKVLVHGTKAASQHVVQCTEKHAQGSAATGDVSAEEGD